MNKIKLFRDSLYDGGNLGSAVITDERESRELLQKAIMNKCGITEMDLQDINIVKAKLRDFNIDEIIK